MDFFTRITPAYKSADNRMQMRSQFAAPSGLMGLLGSLMGRSTPIYKTVDGHVAQVPASSGLLSMFAVTPSYKTAPTVAQVDSDFAEAEVVAAVVEAEAAELGLDDGICVAGADQLVLL
jgi:hypothetical protein